MSQDGAGPVWRSAPVVLLGAAVLCAVVVSITDGPARLVSGLLLVLYLPGRLAVAAALPRRPDPGLAQLLGVALSLAVTALVGLVFAAVRADFRPVPLAAALLGWCAALAGVAVVRGRTGTARATRTGTARAAQRVTAPAGRAGTASAGGTGTAPPGRAVVGRRSVRPGAVWWAALPAVALTAVLVNQLVAVHRHRPADSFFTEFAVAAPGPAGGTTGAGPAEVAASVVVHSRERAAVGFRFESRIDGAVRESTGFTLRPGERRSFTVVVPPRGRVEARLYRDGRPEPYRELSL